MCVGTCVSCNELATCSGCFCASRPVPTGSDSSSLITLSTTRQRLAEAGWMNVNVLCCVFGQRLSPAREQVESAGRKSAKHVRPSCKAEAPVDGDETTESPVHLGLRLFGTPQHHFHPSWVELVPSSSIRQPPPPV